MIDRERNRKNKAGRIIGAILLIALLAMLLSSCQGKPDSGKPTENTEKTEITGTTETTKPEEDDSPKGGIQGVPLEYIGKTYPELLAAFPRLQDMNGYLPNAAAVGVEEPGAKYAFFLYGTQYLPFTSISQGDLGRLRCAGFCTTVGVVFPEFAGLTLDDFRKATGATNWGQGEEQSPDQGFFWFDYEGYSFYVQAWEGQYYNNKPATHMLAGFRLVFADPSIEQANRDILEDDIDPPDLGY